MTIAEMHVWFRQYAQQMGMQNVRAILPEQIDNLINTSIKDTIDEVVNRNVGTTNDRVITDNSKLANINALRTLYKVKTLPTVSDKKVSDFGNNAYSFDSCLIRDALYFVDFSIKYVSIKPPTSQFSSYISAIEDYKTALSAYLASPIASNESSLNSAEAAVTSAESALIAAFASGSATYSRLFPVRIIDDAYLADVLNDWVLSPRMRTPVMVVHASATYKDQSNFELYVGENLETGVYSVASTKYIAFVRCSYIKKPKEVRYLSDIGGTNVDSDLPEQLQIPMLKHAVDLYRASIQGSLFAAQENAKEQQREALRNNARPDNEGYQS